MSQFIFLSLSWLFVRHEKYSTLDLIPVTIIRITLRLIQITPWPANQDARPEFRETTQCSPSDITESEMVTTNSPTECWIKKDGSAPPPTSQVGACCSYCHSVLLSKPFRSHSYQDARPIPSRFSARTYFHDMLPPSCSICRRPSSSGVQTLYLAPWQWFVSGWQHMQNPTCPIDFTCRGRRDNIVHGHWFK